MAKKNILLVDADPANSRILEVSLKKAGYNVTCTHDGDAALDVMKCQVPDLVICDTKLPKLDGYGLVRALHDNAEWAHVPVIFLANQHSVEDKIRGLELGVDDILTKPIFVRELLTRATLALARRIKERIVGKPYGDPPKAHFAGSIADIMVVDLLQAFELAKRAGTITFKTGSRVGRIWFRDGQVIDAEIGSLRGEEAVYRLFVLDEADFEIDFGDVERTDTIAVPTSAVVMEGMRRADEWDRLIEQMPPLSMTFEIDDENLMDRLSEIPDELDGILRLFDGRRTLMEIIDESPFDDLSTLTTLSKLYFEGLLATTDPQHGRGAFSKGSASFAPGEATRRSEPPLWQSRPYNPAVLRALLSSTRPIQATEAEPDMPATTELTAPAAPETDASTAPEVDRASEAALAPAVNAGDGNATPPPAADVAVAQVAGAESDEHAMQAHPSNGRKIAIGLSIVTLSFAAMAIVARSSYRGAHDASSPPTPPIADSPPISTPAPNKPNKPAELGVPAATATVSAAPLASEYAPATRSDPSPLPGSGGSGDFVPRRRRMVRADDASARPAAPTAIAATPAGAKSANDAVDPRAAESLTQRAQQALEKDDTHQASKAAELARQATQRDPTSAEAWLTLGAAYQSLGKEGQALEAYRSCVNKAQGDRVAECRALAGSE
ncbi:MAG: response regulator [Polyangiaceae bacterium]|nr:response regulator [Polyangiaceae bacterium]